MLGFRRKKSPSGGSSTICENKSSADISGLSNLYSPDQSEDGPVHVRDVADVLCEMKKIKGKQLSRVRQLQTEKPDCEISELIEELELADELEVTIAQASLYGLKFRRVEPDDVDRKAFDKLDLMYAKDNHIMSIAMQGEKLSVATSRPGDVFVIEDVKRQTRMDIEVVVCPDEDIEKVCDVLGKEKIDYDLDDIVSDMAEVEVVQEQEEDLEDLEKMAGQSPVIKFVNYLISNAIREGASDIHIEPKDKITRVRCRIDGMLFDTTKSSLKMHPAVVSRIKIMSELDISERRLPQDGKVKVSIGGRGVDLRVSVLPTNHGEKVVIRILDRRSIMLGLEELGMEKQICSAFREQIAMPHGILLVTGPTGSGKSTTLYSALSQMDGEKLNISTVEDPIEYELDFCNQVQVHERIGMNFATALRSLLRQDPDVIMIGEIRDNETARIAVQAALTGHLVLSTLHTNDAASSITRLVNIGIDEYLIAASLNGVLAQRLVRKICPKCKTKYQIPENIRKEIAGSGIKTKKFFRGKGCNACRGSGYAGRMGIYEMLVIDDEFRDIINKDPSANNMRRAFSRSGQPSLFEDGMKKAQQGLTTVEEVLRVTEVYGASTEATPDDEKSVHHK